MTDAPGMQHSFVANPGVANSGPYTCENTFSWQQLVALGVSADEAQTICSGLQVRQLALDYQKRLVQSGVPAPDAKSIAQAIARYDVNGTALPANQRDTFYKFGLAICRAQLWRPYLFSDSPIDTPSPGKQS